MEYIEENKYNIRSYIYTLFKETFKNLDIETIPINIMLLKNIYYGEKIVENKTNLVLSYTLKI